MKKLLAVALVAGLATSSFAFVPLANRQMNLGSYQSAATQGMYYNELDIISASPVELLDYEGNYLYTTWSNARNAAASNATYPTALSWGNNLNNANLSWLQIGVTGDPLGTIGVDGSRAGAIFQHYGSKASPINLDGAGAVEAEYKKTDEVHTSSGAIYGTSDMTSIRTQTQSRDLRYYTNRQQTQWNVGFAKKDMFLGKMDLGFSVVNFNDNPVLTSGGTKSYTDRYLSDNGAEAAGMPSHARIGDTYIASYDENGVSQNAEYLTDLLTQAKYDVSKKLAIKGAVGLRFRNTVNPGGLLNAVGGAQGVLEKNAVTVNASDDKNYAGGQFYSVGTSIKNRGIFDYAVAPTFGAMSAAGVWDYVGNAANLATTDFSDTRSGMGPVLNLEILCKHNKVNLTGVVYMDTVKQNINASQTNREYIRTFTYNPAATTEIRDWTERDYTETIKTTGENTMSNLDIGGKVEFKTLKDIKLSLGGFIRSNTNLNDFSGVAINSVERSAYDDGNAVNNGGTVGLANKPGPLATDGFGVATGFGEGTWTKTTDMVGSGKTETLTTRYVVPMGMEMPMYKDKWIFRAGTAYTLTKTKQTVSNGLQRGFATTVVTTGDALLGTGTAAIAQPASDQSVTYTEVHQTDYTYGIQWNVNESLTIAANAVLDTNANSAAGGASAVKATIFDLDTYRNLSLQAVFKF